MTHGVALTGKAPVQAASGALVAGASGQPVAAGQAASAAAAGTPVLAAIAACEGCHADGSGPRCETCHEPGPAGCRSCHDTLEGGHAAHGATPAEQTRDACGTCHAVPADWRDEAHLADRGDADVVFAGHAVSGGHHPVFRGGTCADTACHNGPGARTPAPQWGMKFDEPICGACHGLPPPSPHPNSERCQTCHGSVSPAIDSIVERPHPNSAVVVDDLDARPCGDCHTTPPETGAHLGHFAPEAAAPVDCTACHLVPEKTTAPGHIDDGTPGVEVVFAAAAGPEARFEAGKCSQVACHGQDTPAWAGEAPCGSCHGVPPVAHPAGRCDRCHPNAAADGRPLDVTRHMDGQVDNRLLGADSCAGCHGPGAPAEPLAPHARHLESYECATCHPVPATPQAEGHMNGAVEVVLAPVPDPATGAPGVGRYDAGRCDVPTCHGNARPTWRPVDARLTCDACHGNPPPDHSPLACERCHGGNVHVDGKVDVTLSDRCDTCHGDPPATGAHIRHTAPQFSKPVPCQACHLTPVATDAAGHIDAPPAEVSLVSGRYDPATGRCADVVCHGGGEGGPRPAPTPAWTDRSGAGSLCGGCHGVPPVGHGPVDCVHCHAPTAGRGMTIAEPANHVDGTLDRSGAAVQTP